MGRLLQLILGCAVNCDDKQEYIQRIMSMEESVQHVVMNAIQEVRFPTQNQLSILKAVLCFNLRTVRFQVGGGGSFQVWS